MTNAKEPQNQIQFDNYKEDPVKLGPYTSHIWKNDPRHMGFLFARYKFCAKMLAGKKNVLEIGCGDAFGTPVVAQVVEKVEGVDFEPLLMEDNKERLSKNFSNISFSLLDITKEPFKQKCDAVFSLDVIEHIKPELEHKFFENICKSLNGDGICIIGTPNIEASKYATPASQEGHINLKSYKDLQNALSRYFKNGFLFSMNDEIIHTGYYPMAHYLIAVGIGPKTELGEWTSGKEIDLLSKYPKTKRNLDERAEQKTEEDKAIAKRFDKEYFDGDRKHGYGGFSYHPRFWTEVVQDFIKHYGLTAESKILDVGCGKGFMLYDFIQALPGLTVRGIDISEYAIEHAKEEVKSFLSVGNAKDLSRFNDNEFDLAVSINTIHNLKLEECKQALKEIQRVSKQAFVVNDAWKNDEEKERMKKWNLTGETVMHVNDWKRLFKEVGYTGDYYWFIP